jgi:ribosome biogenesis GTPase A
MILNDFQRGKLPWYVKPPETDDNKSESKEEKEKIEVPLDKDETVTIFKNFI